VHPVHYLPILKTNADQLSLVGLINHYVPTEMDVGTVVLALVLDSLSGRSPLYRFRQQRPRCNQRWRFGCLLLSLSNSYANLRWFHRTPRRVVGLHASHVSNHGS
jgi:hypothetical protein